MRLAIACAILTVASGASVIGDPVLESAPTPGGPWAAEPEAVVVDLGDRMFRALVPAAETERFYRLMDAGTELDALSMELAVSMEFTAGDVDSDGDGVPDADDQCPGFNDLLDENGNGVPDDCETVPGMVRIPAGSFDMGDTFGEGNSDERPVHAVLVSGFFMETHEVSIALWNEVYTWATEHGYSFDNAGPVRAANHPVQSLYWHDALKWCNARSEKEELVPCYYTSAERTTVYRTGQANVAGDWVQWRANGYRLPTEAEWEKAARGGVAGKRYPWGDTIDGTQANYHDSGDLWDNGTTPVGTYAPSGYGLYETAGNVFEWCWDWYDSSWYGRAEASAADSRGPGSGTHRAIRGGGWDQDTLGLRCANRGGVRPGVAYPILGFRCARSRP